MRLVLVASMTVALVWLAAGVQQARAHPLPKGTSVKLGLHKICVGIGACRDYAPKPQTPCRWANHGQREVIYDPNLDANVTWGCECPWGKDGPCHWVRIMIQPVPADYLKPPNRHHVWDAMRKCASIVCAGFRVDHFYRSMRYYPKRLTEEGADT